MSAATIPTHGVMEGGGSYNLRQDSRWRRRSCIALFGEGGSVLHAPVRKRSNRDRGLRFFTRKKLSGSHAGGHPMSSYASWQRAGRSGYSRRSARE